MDALIAATVEMVRVLKPSGSIWVNLGDKYSSTSTPGPQSQHSTMTGGRHKGVDDVLPRRLTSGAPPKSLIGIPWRYALRCIDDLGLILRAEVIWSKPNGLPESVTDRVRRSHEQWFHFTLQPRYFSAVDEIREEHAPGAFHVSGKGQGQRFGMASMPGQTLSDEQARHPLGKLPGSVWTVPTQPLRVPDHLGVDHFAAFPMEWPRRIIKGWAPTRGVCVECGDGRRPVVAKSLAVMDRGAVGSRGSKFTGMQEFTENRRMGTDPVYGRSEVTLTGEACACPEPTAPTRPATILDPFGGTGTTALVAKALGCHGISVDMSADYCRLAQWRTNDEGEIARALQVDKPAQQVDGQGSLLDLIGGEAS